MSVVEQNIDNNGQVLEAAGLDVNTTQVADNAMDLENGTAAVVVEKTMEAAPSTLLTNEDRNFLKLPFERMKKELSANKGMNTNAPSLRPGARFARKGTNYKAAKRNDSAPTVPEHIRHALLRLNTKTPGWGVQFLLLLGKSPALMKMVRKADVRRVRSLQQRVTHKPKMGQAAAPKRRERVVMRGHAARKATGLQFESQKPEPKAEETLENAPEPTLHEKWKDEQRLATPAPAAHRKARPHMPVAQMRRGQDRPKDHYRDLRRELRHETQPVLRPTSLPRMILALSL